MGGLRCGAPTRLPSQCLSARGRCLVGDAKLTERPDFAPWNRADPQHRHLNLLHSLLDNYVTVWQTEMVELGISYAARPGGQGTLPHTGPREYLWSRMGNNAAWPATANSTPTPDDASSSTPSSPLPLRSAWPSRLHRRGCTSVEALPMGSSLPSSSLDGLSRVSASRDGLRTLAHATRREHPPLVVHSGTLAQANA